MTACNGCGSTQLGEHFCAACGLPVRLLLTTTLPPGAPPAAPEPAPRAPEPVGFEAHLSARQDDLFLVFAALESDRNEPGPDRALVAQVLRLQVSSADAMGRSPALAERFVAWVDHRRDDPRLWAVVGQTPDGTPADTLVHGTWLRRVKALRSPSPSKPTPVTIRDEAPPPKRQVPEDRRSLAVAYVLLIFLGFTGAHRFYLRQWGMGAVFLLSGGGCGMLWLLDFVLLPLHFRRRR